MGLHALLQGTFPSRGLNPCFLGALHLYHEHHAGGPGQPHGTQNKADCATPGVLLTSRIIFEKLTVNFRPRKAWPLPASPNSTPTRSPIHSPPRLFPLLPSQLYTAFFFFNIYLATLGLSCNVGDFQLWRANSQLQHVGSSSLTRNWAPCIGSVEL